MAAEYEYKVTWEQLSIGDLLEGGRRSLIWVPQEREVTDYNSDFYRHMSVASRDQLVPHGNTGISNTIVRNVLRWRRPRVEWELA